MNISYETVKKTIEAYRRVQVVHLERKGPADGTYYIVNGNMVFTSQEISYMYNALKEQGIIKPTKSAAKKSKPSKKGPMTKKGNMAYWDDLDDMAEKFVVDFLSCACTDKGTIAEMKDDIDTTTIGKELIEFLLGRLQDEGVDTAELYPYVDGNY